MKCLDNKSLGSFQGRRFPTKSVETCRLLASVKRVQAALDESDLGSPSSVLLADRQCLLDTGLINSLSLGVIDD
jgi:hypothetical protein